MQRLSCGLLMHRKMPDYIVSKNYIFKPPSDTHNLKKKDQYNLVNTLILFVEKFEKFMYEKLLHLIKN